MGHGWFDGGDRRVGGDAGLCVDTPVGCVDGGGGTKIRTRNAHGQVFVAQQQRPEGVLADECSSVPLSVNAFQLEIGTPEESEYGTESIFVDSRQTTIGGEETDLPARLEYGESLLVSYDEDVLLGRLADYGENGERARVRPSCYDSLGNKHTFGAWIELSRDAVGAHRDPGPGLLAYEDWVERQQRR